MGVFFFSLSPVRSLSLFASGHLTSPIAKLRRRGTKKNRKLSKATSVVVSLFVCLFVFYSPIPCFFFFFSLHLSFSSSLIFLLLFDLLLSSPTSLCIFSFWPEHRNKVRERDASKTPYFDFFLLFFFCLWCFSVSSAFLSFWKCCRVRTVIRCTDTWEGDEPQSSVGLIFLFFFYLLGPPSVHCIQFFFFFLSGFTLPCRHPFVICLVSSATIVVVVFLWSSSFQLILPLFASWCLVVRIN